MKSRQNGEESFGAKVAIKSARQEVDGTSRGWPLASFPLAMPITPMPFIPPSFLKDEGGSSEPLPKGKIIIPVPGIEPGYCR